MRVIAEIAARLALTEAIVRLHSRKVTIIHADTQEVIWTGSYGDFEAENIDSLSVSEFVLLDTRGTLEVGGGAAPHYLITLAPEEGT